MSQRVYAHVVPGRHGLGNMLFPWARAFVFSSQHGCGLLSVNWVRFDRIGPWIRRERDKRYYFRQLSNAGYVGGFRRWLLLRIGKRISEGTATEVGFRSPSFGRPVVVDFRGMEDRFAPIRNRGAEIRGELQRLCHERIREIADAPNEMFIAVHIRRGDFRRAPHPGFIPYGSWNWQLPEWWYRKVIEQIRSALGYDIKVLVFSDEPQSITDEIKEVPNLNVADQQPALADLLRMSRAACIVASGSSYSAWAAYLGSMPSVWYPAGWLDVLGLDEEMGTIVTDTSGMIGQNHLELLVQRVGNRREREASM